MAGRCRHGCHGAIALGTVAQGAFSTAAIGATPDDDFEIGSISKTITGLLYADAVSMGIVDRGTRLGDLLDVGDGPVAAIAIPDLATHRSGLPKLPSGMHPARRTWDLWRRGMNP